MFTREGGRARPCLNPHHPQGKGQEPSAPERHAEMQTGLRWGAFWTNTTKFGRCLQSEKLEILTGPFAANFLPITTLCSDLHGDLARRIAYVPKSGVLVQTWVGSVL